MLTCLSLLPLPIGGCSKTRVQLMANSSPLEVNVLAGFERAKS